jgi:hypothetical protein
VLQTGGLEVWQLPARRLVLKDERIGGASHLVFSPDGRYLTVVNDKATTARVYTFAATDTSVQTAGAQTNDSAVAAV